MTNYGLEPILEVRSVSHSYRRKTHFGRADDHLVLKDVSLRLEDGETLGVIGKNGCGKSTILRLMAGIIAPTSGEIIRRQGATAALLSLGLGFKPNLTGRSNALLAGMLQGSSKIEAESYLEEIKDFSGLGSAFEEPVKTYSSGMRSRLGFTTALKTRVDILLIDEVLAVGDFQFKKKAERALIDRILGDQAVIFVSHSSRQVRSVCDRTVWINDGVIAAEGPTSDVLDLYQSHSKRSR